MTVASSYAFPPGACDCQCHVFGPTARYPFAHARSYTPEEVPYPQVAALHRQLGIDRAVLVQGACHGTDNSAMLAAIATDPRRLRGVALLDPGDFDEPRLRHLHAGGIRGIRFNYAGTASDPSEREVRSALERIAPLRWHLLVHCRSGMLSALSGLIASSPGPVVIDHFGRIAAGAGPDTADYRSLLRLAALEQVWVKISGADRIDDPPFDAAVALARTLLAQDPRRILWGTDFPHPNARHRLADAELAALIPRMLPGPSLQRRVLVDNPARLYDFE